MSGAPLLEIKGLRAGYGETEVLHGIDLLLSEGEFVCIIGANTAGKSTILRSISRQVPHTSGVLSFAGTDLQRCLPHQVPQTWHCSCSRGKADFRRSDRRGEPAARRIHGPQGNRSRDRMDEILKLFPRLQERFGQSAGTLSGGEQQMVAVGRALMLRPKLLLLDEPSHGLAPKVVEEMHDAFVKIHAKGTSILLVEQNVSLALDVATRGYVLESGRITLQGSSSELNQNPAVREAYLGI